MKKKLKARACRRMGILSPPRGGAAAVVGVVVGVRGFLLSDCTYVHICISCFTVTHPSTYIQSNIHTYNHAHTYTIEIYIRIYILPKSIYTDEYTNCTYIHTYPHIQSRHRIKIPSPSLPLHPTLPYPTLSYFLRLVLSRRVVTHRVLSCHAVLLHPIPSPLILSPFHPLSSLNKATPRHVTPLRCAALRCVTPPSHPPYQHSSPSAFIHSFLPFLPFLPFLLLNTLFYSPSSGAGQVFPPPLQHTHTQTQTQRNAAR